MEQTANPTISFQSKTNPQVQITLEFAGCNNESIARKAENELRSILKNIHLEKIKKETFKGAE